MISNIELLSSIIGVLSIICGFLWFFLQQVVIKPLTKQGDRIEANQIKMSDDIKEFKEEQSEIKQEQAAIKAKVSMILSNKELWRNS